MSKRATSIALIILSQVMGMSLWFSASAAIPNLLALGAISGQQASLLTGAVQLGFVAGTLVSATFGLSDRFDPRRIFAASTAAGCIANLFLLVTGFDSIWTVLLRFITGACMAGVYPVGMKLAAGWSVRQLGLMIGALVGALTLGSALPHLFNALHPLDWKLTIVASSGCAMVGAVVIGFVALGPNHSTATRFAPTQALRILRRRSVLLVNLGYLGHMWELYAMWAWIGPFLDWSARRAEASPLPGDTALMTFAVIASGSLGSVVAGAVADKVGRTIVTIVAMLTSGLCAVLIGFSAEFGMIAVFSLALLWGVAVIADSAQFSAAIAELSDPPLIGTMLTLQTCFGFLLTFVAIQLMPIFVVALGWRYAFGILAIGPMLGAVAMWRVRRQPDSSLIAKGMK